MADDNGDSGRRSGGAGEAGGPLVLGIGASAGGLDALKRLLGGMPERPGMAVVVVVHLAPGRESHLAELLQPHCAMPVRQVTGETQLAADRVYVIPPGRALSAIDTHLRIRDFADEQHRRSPIDHFFRTLAQTHDGNAVGVVLTGTGADGTLGLRRIKERGGLTVAQDPDEAEYDGMPRSAIASEMVDLVLPLARMPEHFQRFVAVRPRLMVPGRDRELPEEEVRLLHEIFAQVRAHTGQDFSHYKRSTLLRRIRRRMQLHHVETLGDYLELLRTRRDEVQQLFEDMLITVSEFFRDPEVFDYLERELLPRLFAGKGPEEAVRLWSVGCATGEEAYSLAMLLLEQAGRLDAPPQLQVFASDLHQPSLQRARAGLYAGAIEQNVSAERLQRFFTREGAEYRVRRAVRELVVFAPHNLLKDPPFSHLDLIACRNLLIYLQRDIQQEVVALLHYALEPGGALVLGSAEAVDRGELFEPENKRLSVYRRRGVPGREPKLPIFTQPGSARTAAAAAAGPPADRPERYGTIHEWVVERYGPPSLLVGQDHAVVHYSANAGRYLRLPGGEPTHNLFKLVRDELRGELRAALHTARESGQPARSRPVRLVLDGRPRPVVARVQPVAEPDLRGFFLVLFDEDDQAPAPATGPRPAGESEAELRAELERTQQRLQSVIEEYETGQEEMQAGNEELQSTNEELRSTMEELETSKEELQSMNEELTTLNQENRHKVEELGQLSADLQNLLAATDIATLFLDRGLRIVRYTPPVAELFNIRPSDRERPLTDLTHHLDYDRMVADAQRVLDRLERIEREVHSAAGHTYLARLLPYRGAEDRIQGVVLTFVDISARKRAEQELRRARDELERRVAERTAELRRKNAQLRRLAAELASAEHRERKRLAALLHDDLQQSLMAAKMKLAKAGGQLGEREPAAVVQQATAMLQDATRAARELTRQLRPPALYEDGLVAAFKWLAGEVAQRHEVRLSIEAPDGGTALDDDAKALLFTSVHELVFNAVKHAGTDAVELAVRERDGLLELSVTDRGRGFDPLLEEERSNAEGFGLFSIRERLEALGGGLELDAAPGRGCTAVLRVPLEVVAAGQAPAPPEAAGPSAAGRVRPAPAADQAADAVRVLVVDDRALVREGIANLLVDDPRTALAGEAAEGAEAIAAVERLRPDAVLMDVNMPGMNGIEATREIRRHWPEQVVVGMSVQDDAALIESMRAAGAAAFVAKSADADELIATLLAQVEQSKPD